MPIKMIRESSRRVCARPIVALLTSRRVDEDCHSELEMPDFSGGDVRAVPHAEWMCGTIPGHRTAVG